MMTAAAKENDEIDQCHIAIEPNMAASSTQSARQSLGVRQYGQYQERLMYARMPDQATSDLGAVHAGH